MSHGRPQGPGLVEWSSTDAGASRVSGYSYAHARASTAEQLGRRRAQLEHSLVVQW